MVDYPMYRRLALKRIGDLSQADDVLHGFCLKALERATQLRDTRAVHGWLRRLFETALLDHYRQASRLRARTVSLDEGVGSLADQPGETLWLDEEFVVQHTLSRMRPGYAALIRQVDLSAHEPAAVAEELSISPNNLAVRLHRARAAFRNALADSPVALHV
ncbi:sigma-70 family RNA polymerase sigma factor [Erythrobacter sp. SN021]|uniref:RNA polymerase sigma factor n=1 Tax=Erythrobacter sp. SN021 TaxID=2912574 RepID=UPI001F15D345|nr:sigma-70 family RNA polymerase sigma factor [Erythrobacter sp. SN021]MCF8882060.1 sigma-70 family RNA polymerase sigma factor [Erythrobacter sp. SN021]